MIRLLAVILLIFFAALVSACGVDGEPERPGKTVENGVTVSGRVATGVTF